MIRHTQTIAEPATSDQPAKGNCWQTCAAAILDLPAEVLPHQVEIEDAGWSFNNALSAYLAKHHSMNRVVLYEWQLKAPVDVRDVYHIICGPSVRTATNGGVNHCVVGRAGVSEWDVHPSRAGLIGINEVQFFVKATPEELAKMWRFLSFADRDCLCPACGGVIPKPAEPRPGVAEGETP